MTSVVLTTADLRPIMSVVIEVSAPLEVTCRGSKPINPLHCNRRRSSSGVPAESKSKKKWRKEGGFEPLTLSCPTDLKSATSTR